MPEQPYAYTPPNPYPRPRVRFDAIPEAWALFQQQMGTWVLAAFLMLAVPAFVYFSWFIVITIIAGGFDTRASVPPLSDSQGILMVITTFVMTFAMWVCSTLLTGSMFRMAIKQVRGERISAGDVFSA